MKLLNLETKTAFVTGAGSGIGQRIALGLPQDQSGQTLR
jgi:NAD(P)-dependent dehydrogenase (short-subunit alcohol dehydrogenase family)